MFSSFVCAPHLSPVVFASVDVLVAPCSPHRVPIIQYTYIYIYIYIQLALNVHVKHSHSLTQM